MFVSPVEGVVEDWEDSGEKVWVEFLKIPLYVIQNREHYVQAEIEMFSLDRNSSNLFRMFSRMTNTMCKCLVYSKLFSFD